MRARPPRSSRLPEILLRRIEVVKHLRIIRKYHCSRSEALSRMAT
jgi:hypothetical protein